MLRRQHRRFGERRKIGDLFLNSKFDSVAAVGGKRRIVERFQQFAKLAGPRHGRRGKTCQTLGGRRVVLERGSLGRVRHNRRIHTVFAGRR